MTIPDCGFMTEIGDSCLPCTPEEEKRIISELKSKAESDLQEGNLYYVVSNRWYAGWQRYVGEDTDTCSADTSMHGGIQHVTKRFQRPGPIDNSDLVLNNKDGETDELDIHRTLLEGNDYVLVPEEAWKKLVDWYKGGPPLPRKLISQGLISKSFIVEVHPLRLILLDARDNSELVIKLSKKTALRELYERVCALKGLEKEKVCIWDYFNSTKIELFPSDQTLEDANLLMDQDILLDVKDDASTSARAEVDSTGNELALIPLGLSRSSVTIAGGPSLFDGHSTCSSSSTTPRSSLSSNLSCTDGGPDIYNFRRKGERGGLAGLQNLGNTCFMNSALQCLVHTPPLVKYFLADFSDEINKGNPLGMRGELALAFGDLLKTVWSSGQTAIAPREFRGKVVQFAPQFCGYNQHDSQELLAFLLDGLHEDLNRVKKKPYIEMKDSDGRPDDEYADECWRNHKARNDSIIVDTCQGQYKSTLVCPVCSKVSVTFDPFMYLSLPFPSTVTRAMTVTVFYGDGSHLPKTYTVTVPKQGACRDLTQALGTLCCLRNDESFLLAEVCQHKVDRYWDLPLEPLADIKDEDRIVAYLVPKDRIGLNRVEVNHRRVGRSQTLKLHDGELFGTPLVTYLKQEAETVASIETILERLLSSFKKTTDSSLSNTQSDMESEVDEEIEGATSDIDEVMDEEKKFSYQLIVTDGRGYNAKPVEADYVLKPGQCLKVTLHWKNKELGVYDFSIVEDLPEVNSSGFSTKKTRQETISLFSCLESFLKEEPLGPDDMWYCPSCKEHRQAIKKLDLWKLPEILVVHLKRFSYSRYQKNKLERFVDFPIRDLNLTDYINLNDSSSASQVYELYAISNHYGGLGGGHYTAYAKLIDDDRWYNFDDTHVSAASEDEIKTSAAYVLFYRRVKG